MYTKEIFIFSFVKVNNYVRFILHSSYGREKTNQEIGIKWCYFNLLIYKMFDSIQTNVGL